MTDSLDKKDLDDDELFASRLTFNQDREGARLADLILASASRLQLLHGRRGTGKTTLVRSYLLPRLAEMSDRQVFYSICQPDFPRVARTLDGKQVDLREEIRRRAIIVVDAVDRFFGQEDTEESWAFRHVFPKLRDEDVQATLVLVVSDHALSNVFELRRYEPRIVEAVFSIQEVDVAEGLSKLRAADEGVDFSLSADLVAELRSELEDKGEGVSPELLKALYQQLRKHHLEAEESVLGREVYRNLGGLTGILRSYLVSRLDRLERAEGLEKRRIAGAILREIVGAEAAGRPVDFQEVQRRLDIDEERCSEVLTHLTEEGGVLREVSPGVFDVAPAQLAAGIRQHLVEQALELERPWRLVREAHRSWEKLGLLIAEDRYREIDAYRRRLPLAKEEVAFMFRCSLVYETAPDMTTVKYWRRRLKDSQEVMDILLEHLYYRFADVRVRAATLLGEFDVPEVRDQLHLIALQDEDPQARAAAVNSLEGLRSEGLRDLLLQEVRDPRSRYRRAAVQALRIFRDRQTATALQAMVNNPDTALGLREEAIATLAALGVSEAVDALIEIALEDPDVEDRESAASALATLETPELSDHLLESLRQPRPVRRTDRGGVGSRAIRAAGLLVVAGVLTTAALFLHGLLLLLTPKWRLGVAFLVVEGVGCLLLWQGLAGVGILLLVFGLVGSLGVSGGVLLAGLRNRSLRHGSLQHFLAGTVLIPLGYFSFFLGHGLAHALVGKWARALYLFAMGWLGLGILSLFGTLDVPILFQPSPILTALDPKIRPWLVGPYVTLALLLFIGSFLYDFGLVVWHRVFFRRRLEAQRRRKAVVSTVVTNPSIADKLFEGLHAENPALAKWCRRILSRFGAALPSASLIERLESGNPTEQRWVTRCLKRVDSDTALESLVQLFDQSEPAAQKRIAGILAGKPSQRSLSALAGLRAKLGWWDWARYHRGLWQLRLKLLPTAAIILVVAVLPLVAVYVREGAQMNRHPDRAMVRWIQRPPQMAILSKEEIVAILDKRSVIVEPLAVAFPTRSEEALLVTLETALGLAAPRWWPEAEQEQVNLAIDRHEISLVRALEKIATHPEMTVGPPGERPDQRHSPERIRKKLETYLSDNPRVGDGLQEELRIALIRIHASHGNEEGLAALVGVRRPDDPQEWQRALSGMPQETPVLDEVLQALGTLGSQNATKALVKLALSQNESQPGRADQSALAEPSLQLKAVAVLGSLEGPDANAALQEIATAKIPFVSRNAEQYLRVDIEELYGFLRAGDFERVVAEGDRWLKAGRPSTPELQLLLSRARIGRGEFDEAEDHLDRAGVELKRNDDNRIAVAEGYGELGWVLLGQEDYTRAQRTLRKSLSFDDALGWPQGFLALTLLRQDSFSQAMPYARRAIELRPDFPVGYQALIESYGHVSKWREAEAILEDTIEGHSDQELAVEWATKALAYVYHEGLALEDTSYFERSHELWAHLVDLGDQAGGADPTTLTNYIEGLLTTSRYEQAVRHGQELLERQGVGFENALVTRLCIYASSLLQRDWADAEDALDGLVPALSGDLTELSWSFRGTAHFLSQQGLPQDLEAPLLCLLERLNEGEAMGGFVEASRSALHRQHRDATRE